MKKTLYILCIALGVTASGQKKKTKDILNSTSIPEIESFIKTANPEDPRLSVLKPKLIALKNIAWTKGAKNAKPMAARPIIVDIPKSVMRNPESNEAEEFKKLVAETSKEHSEKTVKILNSLFDQDITSKEAAILVQNNSDCNMIVRVSGKNFYNLAVPAHGENSLVITKGKYDFASNVCGAQYKSAKDVQKGMVIILNNPVVTIPVKK